MKIVVSVPPTRRSTVMTTNYDTTQYNNMTKYDTFNEYLCIAHCVIFFYFKQ